MSYINQVPSTINVTANITVGSQFTGQNIVLSGATLPLQIHGFGNPNNLFVSGNGAVGIGLAPTATLTISGTGPATSVTIHSALTPNIMTVSGAGISFFAKTAQGQQNIGSFVLDTTSIDGFSSTLPSIGSSITGVTDASVASVNAALGSVRTSLADIGSRMNHFRTALAGYGLLL